MRWYNNGYWNVISQVCIRCLPLHITLLKDNAGVKWLIVWDNVESWDHIRAHWPSSKGSMLLTTRFQKVAAIKGQTLALSPLKVADGWELFKSIMDWKDFDSVDQTEVNAAKVLLDKTQGLPLGIRQLAFLIKVKHKGVAHFLNRYSKGRVKAETSSQIDDYEFTIDTVWHDAFTTLENCLNSDGTHGFDLLGVITYLSPDRIPNELFQVDKMTKLPESLLFCSDEDESVLEQMTTSFSVADCS